MAFHQTSARFNFFIWALVACLATGCGPNMQVVSEQKSESSQTVDEEEPDYPDLPPTEPLPEDPNNPSPSPTPPPINVAPFCSKLSFQGITWNSSLTPWARRSMSIALSLSGSFEGRSGWTNITNNFDGMGLSAGLLNQTLGTASLQPLLSQLKKNNPSVYSSNLALARRDSIFKMISNWEKATGFKPLNAKATTLTWQSLNGLPDPTDMNSSSLDLDFNEEENFRLETMMTSSSRQSVSWAVSNLYTSTGAFKPEWKSELQKVLGHPEYVSLQISAALKIHRKALQYMNRVRMNDLRTYLLMFDIVVQNGGLYDSEFTEWEKVVKAKGLTTPSSQLKALIDLRLKRVRPQYVSDVRSRKYAIIDGAGKVHGSNRKLAQEYCYSPTDTVL